LTLKYLASKDIISDQWRRNEYKRAETPGNTLFCLFPQLCWLYKYS